MTGMKSHNIIGSETKQRQRWGYIPGATLSSLSKPKPVLSHPIKLAIAVLFGFSVAIILLAAEGTLPVH